MKRIGATFEDKSTRCFMEKKQYALEFYTYLQANLLCKYNKSKKLVFLIEANKIINN